MSCARVSCTCQHEQQDKMYGKGVRVANVVNKANSPKGSKVVRCTVCSKQHTVSEGRVR